MNKEIFQSGIYDLKSKSKTILFSAYGDSPYY